MRRGFDSLSSLIFFRQLSNVVISRKFSQLVNPVSTNTSQFPSKRLASLLTSLHTSQLSSCGFTIIDNAFGNEWCNSFLNECKELYNNDLMEINRTRLVTPTTSNARDRDDSDKETRTSPQLMLSKPGIYEMDADMEGIEPIIPTLSQWFHDGTLINLFNQYYPHLHLASQSLKMQVNSANAACFPLHFDSDTLIDGDYQSSNGGELKLYPFPYTPITIEPLYDRLVIFSSINTLHRVLPSHALRYCVTLWLSSEGNFSSSSPSTTTSTKLNSSYSNDFPSTLYPHLCKLLYDKEWERSLSESHLSSPSTYHAINQHKKDVAIIKKALTTIFPDITSNLSMQPLPSECLPLLDMKGVRLSIHDQEKDTSSKTGNEKNDEQREWKYRYRFI